MTYPGIYTCISLLGLGSETMMNRNLASVLHLYMPRCKHTDRNSNPHPWVQIPRQCVPWSLTAGAVPYPGWWVRFEFLNF